MQTGDDDRGVGQAEERAADRAEGVVGPGQTVSDAVGQDASDGADDDEGQEAGGEYCDERGQQEVRRA